MKNKPSLDHSSLLVSLPALAILLLGCVLAAFWGQWQTALVLMFLFLLAGVSRLWAVLSARGLSVAVSGAVRGMFPGEDARLELTIRNGKFLPVVWLELFFPLSRSLCMTPEGSRKPDDWELSGLKDAHASTQLVGSKRCPLLLWYETARLEVRWHAVRRGIYSGEVWRLRTGDGFGLTQVDVPLPEQAACTFAVYPQLVEVRSDLFLRNLWNADTGTRGVMEDPTVIRSTRAYMSTDSLKHINWRLTARGFPLSVNVYEDILPKSVHFILDGESFSGSDPHPAELEETLSILASELVRLEWAQVRCGVSLCSGMGGEAVNLFAASSTTEDLLCALAAYEPAAPVSSEENGRILDQQPVFDLVPLVQAVQSVGRFYYIAYDTDRLPARSLLTRFLDHTRTSILTYRDTAPFGEYETVCLCSLKEDRHGASE